MQSLVPHDPRLEQWRPMVCGVARHFLKKLGRVYLLEDLVGIGMEALLRATKNYDAGNASNAQFQTYARRVVRNSFLKEHEYWGEQKRRIVYSEMSGDQQLGSDGDLTLFTVIPHASPSPVEDLCRVETARLVQRGLQRLTSREQTVLKLRFEDEQTQQEIGERFRMSRERVRQLEQEALIKLRKSISRYFQEIAPEVKNMRPSLGRLGKKTPPRKVARISATT